MLLDGVLPAGEGVFVDLEQEELESISPSVVMNTTESEPDGAPCS